MILITYKSSAISYTTSSIFGPNQIALVKTSSILIYTLFPIDIFEHVQYLLMILMYLLHWIRLHIIVQQLH